MEYENNIYEYARVSGAVLVQIFPEDFLGIVEKWEK